jgi:hypothetical protein
MSSGNLHKLSVSKHLATSNNSGAESIIESIEPRRNESPHRIQAGTWEIFIFKEPQSMPNVTVQLSDDSYRRARVWCAQNDTNVSRAVRDILEFLPKVSTWKFEQFRSGKSTTPASNAMPSTPAGAINSSSSTTPAPQPLASSSPVPATKKLQNQFRTAKLQNCKCRGKRAQNQKVPRSAKATGKTVKL